MCTGHFFSFLPLLLLFPTGHKHFLYTSVLQAALHVHVERESCRRKHTRIQIRTYALGGAAVCSVYTQSERRYTHIDSTSTIVTLSLSTRVPCPSAHLK